MSRRTKRGGQSSQTDRLVPSRPDLASRQDGNPVVLVEEEAGSSTLVAFDTEKLEQPTLALSANAVTCSASGNEIALIFAQVAGASVHAALVVHMTRAAVRSVLVENNESFVPRTLEFARGKGYAPEQLAREIDVGSIPPGRAVFERAAIASIAWVDEEADARFWRLQPARMRKVSPQRLGEAVVPVVEVYFPTLELAGLLHRLSSMLEDRHD